MTPSLALVLLYWILGVSSFDVVREYKGNTFFNDANGKPKWDWFGMWDNLTLGDVWYLDQPSAFSQHLAYINNAGNAVIRVDNTSNVPFNEKRNSVRITTKDAYDVGSLWIASFTHVPWGCSVWPAYWSVGAVWPDDGEIDIFEAINLQTRNQMALHTTGGCVHITPPDQKGSSQGGDSGADCSTAAGCVVAETAPNSYASGFAAAGGGVWATQFDVSGIYIWYWSRPDVPASVNQATSTSRFDISTWGPPSASFPATRCNIAEFFGSQNIILDITLCGDWAGVPSIFANTGCSGQCYADYVVGEGSKYDNAYFEVEYLRVYTAATGPTPTSSPTSLSGISSPTHTTSVFAPGNGNNGANNGGQPANSATVLKAGSFSLFSAFFVLGVLW